MPPSISLLDIFRSSLRLIGGLRPGQAPGTAWLTDILWVANAMLDEWNVDRNMIFEVQRGVYPLVPNQLSYQIGPGAPDFNVARPVQIEYASIINTESTPYPNEVPIKLLSDQEWAQEPYKSGVIFSPIPTRMYIDRGNPIATITLLPICNYPNQLVLYDWSALPQLTNVSGNFTDSFIFPPGYLNALRYNLAIAIGQEFHNSIWFEAREEPSATLIELARSSKAYVASVNADMPVMMCDGAIRSMNRAGWYDWLSNVIR